MRPIEEEQERESERERERENIIRRLEALEQTGSPVQSAWKLQGPGGEEGDRGPAVVLGGWKSDTDADSVLQKAKQFIEAHQIRIPTEEAFTPGKQRGFVVVPIRCLPGESQQIMTRRAIAAVEWSSKGRCMQSRDQDSAGKMMEVWMALSQSGACWRRQFRSPGLGLQTLHEPHGGLTPFP